MNKAGLDDYVDVLKAAGEVTRARVLALLAHGELSVGELAQILRQSQPRLSRHMKYLSAAGLVERMPEGAWVFYRLATSGVGKAFIDNVLPMLNEADSEIERDAERLTEVRSARRETASAYFARVAEDWDSLRALHYPEKEIEQAVLKIVGDGPFNVIYDMGTGTGRMLTLLSGVAEHVEGIDLSHQMLTVARSNLDAAQVNNAVVRHGDATSAPFEDGAADVVIVHQVLHFLDEPARAIQEAARVLKPGGRLIVVDFAPHDLEYLRRDQSHRFLGFEDETLSNWCVKSGLELTQAQLFEAPSDIESGLAVKVWTAHAKIPAHKKEHVV